ncbi:major tail protein [Streptomyces phage LibertyBell]|nr:major tail protein [Streptomyces phage LibertyBell]
MPRLTWGDAGSRHYETGVDRGVLYVGTQPGVAWMGLTSVDESPNGGENRSYYLDGVKYLQTAGPEEFRATVNAYTYPDEFAECDGTASVRPGLSVGQQRRKHFGLSYRTKIGNDLSEEAGYKIHIVYNALAEPSQKSYNTIGESPEPLTFSWNITTRPPVMSGYKRSAHIVIDSRTTAPGTLKAVEDILYGNDTNPPKIPTLAELIEIYDTPDFSLTVTANPDGTYTIEGPDSAVQALTTSTYQIIWDTVVPVGENTYSISS